MSEWMIGKTENLILPNDSEKVKERKRTADSKRLALLREISEIEKATDHSVAALVRDRT